MASDKMVNGMTADHDNHDLRRLTVDSAEAWRTVSIAGVNLPGGIREALHNVGMQRATLVRHHPGAAPPYPQELLRIEELDGSPLSNERIGRHWHQPPYALPLRLARYAPMSVEPEVLDLAVIGTRGK